MINLFCHQNPNAVHSSQAWASNYELANVWPSSKTFDKRWYTYQFVSTLSQLDPGHKLFNIVNYSESSTNGYYTIFYGNIQSITSNLGLMFISPCIVDKINAGELKLLLIYVHETYDNSISMEDWYNTLGTALSYVGIHKSKSVVVLNGTQQSNLKIWDNRISHIYYPWFEVNLRTMIKQCNINQLPDIDYANKDKIFINLNSQSRPHRLLLVLFLYYKNLSQYGYLSWHDDTNNLWSKVKDHGYYKFSYETYNHSEEEFLSFVQHHDIIHKMELDDDPFTEHKNSWIGCNYYFKKSYIDIVSETKATSSPGTVFLTEKIFKPIFYGMPFIVNGSQYQLAGLKNLGYETFPELFDESYDAEPASIKKILMIGEQIKNCCTDNMLLEKLQLPVVQEKLKYNQQLFWNKPHDILMHDLLYNAFIENAQ